MKKLFAIALTIVLVPMLFGANETDIVNQPMQPTTHSSRSLLINRQPENIYFNRSNLLFDQQSPTQGAFVACQYDSVMGFYPRFADNFTVPYDANIDSVVWWGGYWNGTPTPPLDFYVEFYPDSGGGNGPKQVAVYSQRVGYTEYDLSGWYRYEAVIPPFLATTSETLWVVFQPILIFPPQWGNNADVPPSWGDGQEGYFKSAYFGYPQWVTATTVFGVPYETGFQIYGNAASDTVRWDFETGLQGWTHTNGLEFPEAWAVKESGLHGSYTPPAAGDSSMWIDSDAAGSGTTVHDTALSPVIIPNTTNTNWLWYGFGFNNLSSDFFEVGIKYFDGTSWTAVPLRTYNADTVGADSVDVSAYNTYQWIQVYFYYDAPSWVWYAAFDNVTINGEIYVAAHDVGVAAVLSPPEGPVAPVDYDVIGQIHNWGNNSETFNATANVYDTTDSWNVIFTQTVSFTDFPSGADSSHNFGTVTFPADKVFYTEIFTDLVDDNPDNDTASIYSRTALGLGDVVFEMDVETPTGDNQCLGVEFDGTYFYVTGGGAGSDPNKVYVLDTLGTLIWTLNQPSHSTGWGWRDIAWDGVYAGADRIDTLYASVNANVDYFGIDLTNGTLNYYGSSPGAANPNRALAWDSDSAWFFTADWDPCYKFLKDGTIVQGPITGPGSLYGSAYDNGDPVEDGPWVWWHGQTGPTGCHIEQMEPVTMTFTGVNCDIYSTITSGIAGGLSFYSGFRGMDVLFALIQGTPDAIIGIYVRSSVGVAEKPGVETPVSFGFAPNMPNPTRGYAPITYSTTQSGKVSLRVYDGTGRLVKTLVNRPTEPAGTKTVYWKAGNLSNGVYFLRLEAEDKVATHKLVLVR